MTTQKTTVGRIDPQVLAYTAGKDVELDRQLMDADCIGTAAHVKMLSEMPIDPPLISRAECGKVIKQLVAAMQDARRGGFEITLADQDVHLALERRLTERLGALGKKVHTGRSRNDQVALDLRLYAREELLGMIGETAELAEVLFRFGRKHARLPMVGRTHMQKAMPSSVGLWAAAHGESLLDDLVLLQAAYEVNDQCPLGSAAGYGVPLPTDRQRVSDLLGFRQPVHGVLYAGNARGKVEAILLQAASQVMLTLSRLAQDLVLFTMPEFDYFRLPEGFSTGSSIMPQKNNPDVLELVRARASRVASQADMVMSIIRSSASGYNRDIQEAKEPFLDGLATTRATLRILAPLVAGLRPNPGALRAAFTPEVFATDRALELVAEGMPFRDAYDEVKANVAALAAMDPDQALARKRHLGATAGLDFALLLKRAGARRREAARRRRAIHRAFGRLLGVPYAQCVRS